MNRPSLALIAVHLLLLPSAADAQEVWVVEGRVVESGRDVGIQNADVELDGFGTISTTAVGTFRFEGVGSGSYTLRVRALGYRGSTRLVDVSGPVTVIVPLEVAPIALDSLLVESRLVEIEGRVVDAERNLRLLGVDVVTNQVPATLTNSHGLFKLKVVEGVSLRIGIRAFGYLPMDTLVVPEKDDEYRFELAVDSVLESMVAVETARLEERAVGAQRSITVRAINRESLLKKSGWTLRDVLLTGRSRFLRVKCVVLDEVALEGSGIDHRLQTTLAKEVERVEFLFDGAMIRIYTREFMRRMVGGGLPLETPTYSDMARPPFCT